MQSSWARFVVSVVVWVGASAGAAPVLAQAASAAPESKAARAPVAASSMRVELREVEEVYAADALIEAVRAASVSAQTAGVVTRLYVDAGDVVRRGQMLATIDTRETDAQVAAAGALVAQAEAQAAQARLHYERTTQLMQQKFVSQAAVDQAAADYKAAQATLGVARAGSTTARTVRSFAELRAPFDGVVSRRLVDAGELAVAGRVLFELHDPGALRAVGSVPQFMLGRIVGVKSATVTLLPGGQTLRATRVTVLPAADARLLATQVRADLPAQLPSGVVPGTAAKILLPVGRARKLVMPAVAVIRNGELTLARVETQDGSTRLRQIRVGEPVEADGAWVEVLAGLEVGERVVPNPLAGVAR